MNEAAELSPGVIAELTPTRMRVGLRDRFTKTIRVRRDLERELPIWYEGPSVPEAPTPDLSDPAAQVVLRPEWLKAVSVLRPEPAQTRESITVPICQRTDPTDTVLYEDPKNAELRYYLPRYRVAMDGDRVAISFAEHGGAWRLTIDLEGFAAPELGDVGGAGPLPHSLGVVLGYEIGDGRFEQPFVISETPEGRRRATLELPEQALRDVIYQALGDASHRTRLVIRRLITVAVPAGGEPPAADATAVRMIAVNPGLLATTHLAAATPPPTPVESEAVDSDALRRLTERGVRLDHTLWPGLREKVASGLGLPKPTYREVTVSLDHDERQSFVFPPSLYGYVFGGIAGGGAQTSFRLYYHEFAGRQHRYYRDPLDRRVFHYLPDAFKLARQPAPPHAPTLALRYVPGTKGLEDMGVELDYFAVPYTDPARLADAAATLPARLDDDPLEEGEQPQFRVLSVAREKLKLFVGLPGASADPTTAGSAADVELSTVIRDRLKMSAKDFQALWNALFSATPVLFQGSVEVSLSDGTEQVPFTARMDDLVGSVLTERERALEHGSVDLTLMNGIESPVTVRGVTAQLMRDSVVEQATVSGIDTAGPIKIEPGGELSLRIDPLEPRANGGPSDAVVAFEDLDVELDRDAVYEAILDPAAELDFVRAITVKGAHLFGSASADDPLIAVLVEFERGTTVELTPDKGEGQGLVRLPLADFILGRASSADVANAKYRYRTHVVRQGGATPGEHWFEWTSDILYPQTAPSTAAPVSPAPTPEGPGQ